MFHMEIRHKHKNKAVNYQRGTNKLKNNFRNQTLLLTYYQNSLVTNKRSINQYSSQSTEWQNVAWNMQHCPYPREQLSSEISKKFLEISEKNIKIPIIKQKANCSKGRRRAGKWTKHPTSAILPWAFGFQIQSHNHLNCPPRKENLDTP